MKVKYIRKSDISLTKGKIYEVLRNLCGHEGALIDGWKLCCDAFPDEILRRFDYGSVKERKE